MTVKEYIYWILEIAVVFIFFFEILPPKIRIPRIIIAFAVLLPSVVFYFSNSPLNEMWQRYLLRLVLVSIALMIGFEQDIKHALYFSAAFTSSINAIQSARPYFQSLLGEGLINAGWALFLLLELILLFLVSKAIPFDKIKDIRIPQIIVSAVVAILVVYSKTVMYNYLRGFIEITTSVSIYPVFIMLLALAVISGFDRLIVSSEENKNLSVMATARDLEYKNIKDKLASQNEIDGIYHDMKNHLIALKSVETGDKNRYIDELLDEMQKSQIRYSTGIDVIDGLLKVKHKECIDKNIRFSADLDASTLSYISPVDLCTIFGNAIDNAIEAAQLISDESKRFVRIKCSYYADQLIVVVENGYETLVEADETTVLKSTKTDKRHHGLGLRNIKRTLSKNNGSFVIDTSAPGIFSLKIMLPSNKAL